MKGSKQVNPGGRPGDRDRANGVPDPRAAIGGDGAIRDSVGRCLSATARFL